MNGDVLELASGERVEIIADPNLAANTVAVRRGVGRDDRPAPARSTTRSA